MSMTLTPLTPAVGVEIGNVDLTAVNAAEFAQIEAAWHRHSVLLFRGQKLSDDDLLAFSRRFGELDPPPNQERGRHQPAGLSGHLCRLQRARRQRRADRRARRRRSGLAHRHELSRHCRPTPRCSTRSRSRRAAATPGSAACRRPARPCRHDLKAKLGNRRIKHDGTYNSGGYLRQGRDADRRSAQGARRLASGDLRASG